MDDGCYRRYFRQQDQQLRRDSILTMDNFKDKDGKGDFVISRNHIVANPKGIDKPDDWRPNGIVLGAVDLRNLKMDEYVKYRVENNFIKGARR